MILLIRSIRRYFLTFILINSHSFTVNCIKTNRVPAYVETIAKIVIIVTLKINERNKKQSYKLWYISLIVYFYIFIIKCCLFEFDFGTSLVCIRWFSMYITYAYKRICTVISMWIIIITTVSTTLIMVYVQIRYRRKYSDDLLGTTKRSFTVDDFARKTCHPRRILRTHIKDLNVSTISYQIIRFYSNDKSRGTNPWTKWIISTSLLFVSYESLPLFVKQSRALLCSIYRLFLF